MRSRPAVAHVRASPRRQVSNAALPIAFDRSEREAGKSDGSDPNDHHLHADTDRTLSTFGLPTVTKTDPSSQSYWNFNMGWTDDAKVVAVNNILYTTGNVSGPFSYPNLGTIGGTSAPFEAKAGTPVTYSVTQDNGPDSSAYSLYYTLERLE
jgi:hypothetical protein